MAQSLHSLCHTYTACIYFVVHLYIRSYRVLIMRVLPQGLQPLMRNAHGRLVLFYLVHIESHTLGTVV